MPRPVAPSQLDGVTVLEVGTLIAGPFCGRLLADMGARVIKIEAPTTGDPLRDWSYVTEHGSLWSFVQSRGKESVAIDLRSREGQRLVARLAGKADIVVENFRPGRMEEWGLGPADLREANPGLVYVRISGFGQTGPYRARPGFGSTGEALGGIRFITGFADRPPLRVGVSLGDSVAALYAVAGALAALERRRRTGHGEVVDVALYEAVFSLLESVLPEYVYAGLVRERRGNTLPGSAPTNTYPTADGGFIAIGANSDAFFRRLCGLMGKPELADDPRFASNQARRRNIDEVDALVEEWTSQHPMLELWERLVEAEIPAGPIYNIADIVADPQYAAREMILMIPSPEVGDIAMPGLVPKFESSAGGVRWAGPRLGAHTASVLAGDLEITAEEMARLEEAGVIAT